MKLPFLLLGILLVPNFATADKPFDKAPKGHAFDLNVFNGTYQLVSEAGKTPCPGTDGKAIAIRFTSNTPNNPQGSQRFNDYIGFWDNAGQGGMSESIDFIDQGKDILEYTNGPNTLFEVLGCETSLSSEARKSCYKSKEYNDAYYADRGIRADRTKVETNAFSHAGMVIRDHVSSRSVQFTNNTADYSEEVRRQVLARDGSEVTFTSFLNSETVRECTYQKME